MQPDIVAGDPLWQGIAGTAALLFILWNMRDGWRRGFWKKSLGLAALVAAYTCAFLFNVPAAEMLQGTLPYPFLLLRGIGGTLVAIVAYVIVRWVCGMLLPGKDEEDDAEPSRTGGMLAGLLVGAFWLFAVVVGVRFVGNFAQCAITAQGGDLEAAYQEHPVIAQLVKLKESVDLGVVGDITRAADPVPQIVYSVTEKTIRLLQNPEAARAFADNPKVQRLMQDPLIIALSEDPEVRALVQEGNYHTLLRNEKLRQVADNPQVQEKLADVDFEAALDEALQKANDTQTVSADAVNQMLPAEPKN